MSGILRLPRGKPRGHLFGVQAYRLPVFVLASPPDDVIPDAADVAKQVREQELDDRGVISEQRHCTARDGVSTKLAVMAVIEAPKPPRAACRSFAGAKNSLRSG